MKKKPSKSKKPVWSKENSPKVLKKIYTNMDSRALKERVKRNNKIAEFLKGRGWSFWDAVNIWEDGYTFFFKKELDALQKRGISFSWHWDQNNFVAKMYGVHDLVPTDTFYHPVISAEICGITERYLVDVCVMEQRIFTALSNQTVIRES